MDKPALVFADEARIVEVDGIGLETHIYHSAKDVVSPTMVFLHEGLGSASMWGDFPSQIVRKTGLPAVSYSRSGYGKSSRRAAAYDKDFIHLEALTVLPALLECLEIVEPILIGHSDGGSIALVHAADHGVTGVIVEAPHLFVEEISIKAISDLWSTREDKNLVTKLARFHDDPEHALEGWKDIWLKPTFRDWNIFDYVKRITCPILAIQGGADQYGTMAQIDGIASNASGPVTLSKLSQCGHSPHREETDIVARRIIQFIQRIRESDE